MSIAFDTSQPGLDIEQPCSDPSVPLGGVRPALYSKSELAGDTIWGGYTDAYRDLFEYLEMYYNRERIHSALGWITPAQFEQLTAQWAA